MTCEYTPEIADIICQGLVAGLTVPEACRQVSMLPYEYYQWRRDHPEFKAAVDAAHEDRAVALAEGALDIADTVGADRDEVAKATLQVNTRKWLAAVLAPRRYGEKVEHSGTVSYAAIPIPVTERHSDALDSAKRPPTQRH